MDLGKIDLLVYFLGYISIKKVAAKPQISLIALSRMYVRKSCCNICFLSLFVAK